MNEENEEYESQRASAPSTTLQKSALYSLFERDFQMLEESLLNTFHSYESTVLDAQKQQEEFFRVREELATLKHELAAAFSTITLLNQTHGDVMEKQKQSMYLLTAKQSQLTAQQIEIQALAHQLQELRRVLVQSETTHTKEVETLKSALQKSELEQKQLLQAASDDCTMLHNEIHNLHHQLRELHSLQQEHAVLGSKSRQQDAQITALQDQLQQARNNMTALTQQQARAAQAVTNNRIAHFGSAHPFDNDFDHAGEDIDLGLSMDGSGKQGTKRGSKASAATTTTTTKRAPRAKKNAAAKDNNGDDDENLEDGAAASNTKPKRVRKPKATAAAASPTSTATTTAGKTKAGKTKVVSMLTNSDEGSDADGPKATKGAKGAKTPSKAALGDLLEGLEDDIYDQMDVMDDDDKDMGHGKAGKGGNKAKQTVTAASKTAKAKVAAAVANRFAISSSDSEPDYSVYSLSSPGKQGGGRGNGGGGDRAGNSSSGLTTTRNSLTSPPNSMLSIKSPFSALLNDQADSGKKYPPGHVLSGVKDTTQQSRRVKLASFTISSSDEDDSLGLGKSGQFLNTNKDKASWGTQTQNLPPSDKNDAFAHGDPCDIINLAHLDQQGYGTSMQMGLGMGMGDEQSSSHPDPFSSTPDEAQLAPPPATTTTGAPSIPLSSHIDLENITSNSQFLRRSNGQKTVQPVASSPFLRAPTFLE